MNFKLNNITGLIISLIIFLNIANGQPIKSTWTIESIVNWVDEYMVNTVKFDQFNGCVLIARNGKVIYKKAFGLANRELNVPNKTNTRFLIGSVSKQFTAAAIMQLQEKGKLSINEAIDKYIDSCPPAWKTITIKQLLNHTSGIVNFTALEEVSGSFLMLPHPHDEILNLFRNKPLESKPGEMFNYNNSGYYLLGMIVEKVTGEKFADYVRKSLFIPLGMSNTDFDDQSTIINERASSYSLSDDKVFYNAYYTNTKTLFSIGGMYSTVDDLLAWQESFLNRKLLSASSINEMLQPGKGNYGYSWVIDKLGTVRRQYHDGGILSFSASLQYLPDEQITIIAISNSGEDGGIRVAYDIAGKIGNNPVTIRAIQQELMKFTAEQSLSLINRYKEGFPNFDIQETKVIEVGNYLMLLKQKKKAIEVFKLTTLIYPKSAIAFLKLAMAFESDSNKEFAIRNYKNCLLIEPGNTVAKEHLANLMKNLK